ncbi:MULTISPECIES: class I adenylate-forming enzyme family protein [unclassified Nocardioides]|uniref:class I adenylate-forming enzyme family protein n=1 Tax=unclassified Nocardioides TaxID=2615069 RepID=UPI0036237925
MTPVRVGDWLTAAAGFQGDREALIEGERRPTYSELNARVNQLADALATAGVVKGDRVALFATDSIEYVEVIFACIKLGATYVPLNYRLSEPELLLLLRTSGARHLFVGGRYGPMIEAVRSGVPDLRTVVSFDGPGPAIDVVYEDLIARGRDLEPDVDVDDDDLLGIAFTSGTTGTPKGVLHHQRVVKHFTWQTFVEARIPPGVVNYSPSPLYHNAGLLYVFAGIARGFTSLISPEFEAGRVLGLLQGGELSRCFLVPTMISSLLELPGAADFDYDNLQCISYGGAPMSPALLRRAMDVFDCDFINMFGAGTEAGLQTLLGPEEHRRALNGEEHLLNSIGRPAAGVTLRLVDEEFNDVPDGEVGEIVTRSDVIMAGYLDQAAESAGKVVNGWYRGGDMAWRDSEGYLYLGGRRSDMIIRGGENVYPNEIESVLADLPGVVEVAVIGVPDAHWGEIVRAVVVMAEGSPFDDAAAVELCRSRLAAYKVPAEFREMTSLPKNPSGKILKRELRRLP